MNIFIFKRTNTLWNDLDSESHIQSIRVGIHPFTDEEKTHAFIQNIKIWNSVLKMTYVQFRKQLSDIAKESIRSTGIPVVEHLRDLPDENALVIPMDDDDLLSPDILSHVERIPNIAHVKAVIWNSLSADFAKKEFRFKRDIITAPSYAVRANACSFDSILWHTQFENTYRNLEHVVLKEYLSVYLRHPGSTYLLKNNLIDLNTYKADSFDVTFAPLSWSRPYVKKIKDLLTQVF